MLFLSRPEMVVQNSYWVNGCCFVWNLSEVADKKVLHQVERIPTSKPRRYFRPNLSKSPRRAAPSREVNFPHRIGAVRFVRKTDAPFRSDPGRIQHGSTSGSCPELVPSKIAMFYTIAVLDRVQNIVPELSGCNVDKKVRHRAPRKIGAILRRQIAHFQGVRHKNRVFLWVSSPGRIAAACPPSV